VVYGSILYFMVGLNPDRFPQFLGIAMSVSITAVSLGLLISAAMPTLEAANAVGPLLVIIMILFGGFYIDVESLPQVADLVPYVSIIRWAFQSFAINEYRGMVFECIPGKKCLQTGEQVLESLGFASKGLDFFLGGLYLLCVGFVLQAYIALLRSKAEYSVLNFVSKYSDASHRHRCWGPGSKRGDEFRYSNF